MGMVDVTNHSSHLQTHELYRVTSRRVIKLCYQATTVTALAFTAQEPGDMTQGPCPSQEVHHVFSESSQETLIQSLHESFPVCP